MKKEKNNKQIKGKLAELYYTNPYIWYRFFAVIIAELLWIMICVFLFVWGCSQMKMKNKEYCEEVHVLLKNLEEQCKEQVTDIYKDPKLWKDFSLFWNYDLEGYMEQRLLENDSDGSEKSFPDYMNVFFTENKKKFTKIYFVTEKSIYVLQASQGGGGGVYNNDISDKEYLEEMQSGENGYPISVHVQDKDDKKTNVGEIVFLLNEDYLIDYLKAEDNTCITYATLEYRNTKKSRSEDEKYKSFGVFWGIYECAEHGIKIEIGFRISDVLRKYRKVFEIITAIIACGTILMFKWFGYLAKNEEKFLNRLIHSIQLAKKGEFQQVEVSKRKGVYTILANEINDMIVNLDLHIKKEYLLKIDQQKIEMQAMLCQINPHFLYNTLEIIRAQVNVGANDIAADTLFNLGSMYRILVKLSDTITMRQEVKLLTHYLNIMESAHQDNFYYEIDMDEELLEMETVKLWLQPLAENYFVHGYDTSREFNLFSVQGQKKEKGYRILIMDNGSGMEEEAMEKLNQELKQQTGMPKEKIGIPNVCQRLRYFYQNRMTFRLEKNNPRGLCIEVYIEKS